MRLCLIRRAGSPSFTRASRFRSDRLPTIQARRLNRSALEQLGLFGPVYRSIQRRVASTDPGAIPAGDHLPMPPPELIALVDTNPRVAWFLRRGTKGGPHACRACTKARHAVEVAGAVLEALERSGWAMNTQVVEGWNYMGAFTTRAAFAEICRCRFKVLEILLSRPAEGHQALAVPRRPS